MGCLSDVSFGLLKYYSLQLVAVVAVSITS